MPARPENADMRLSKHGTSVGWYQLSLAHAREDNPLAQNGVNQADHQSKDGCGCEVCVHGRVAGVRAVLCRLTFELTPTAEAGGVSPVTDDATNGGRRAYDACRSGSGAERGVRPH